MFKIMRRRKMKHPLYKYSCMNADCQYVDYSHKRPDGWRCRKCDYYLVMITKVKKEEDEWNLSSE